MQLLVNLIVAILGLLSLIFGLVGVGVMTTFWRVGHVVVGILMIWCAAPLILDRFLPHNPRRRR